MLGGVDNQKTEFRQILKFWPKIFKISSLYNLGPKKPKSPKYLKVRKMATKSRNYDFKAPKGNLSMSAFR